MKKVDALLSELAARGGTALHVRPDSPPLARVDGVLAPLRSEELDGHRTRELLAELIDDERRARFAAELDLTFSYELEGTGAFRVTMAHTAAGPAGVFRRLAAPALGLADLGAPEGLRALAERTSGLVLVASPRGGGRSTTMAALLAHLNETRAVHIGMIESPIRARVPSKRAQVTQREVGRHAATAGVALRAAARDNVDVVFVSSIDDPDAARVAFDLALDGALVVAGVVAPDAITAVEHLLSRFSSAEAEHARALLADALAGVIAQQLLPSTDGRGRVPVFEVLVATPEVDAAVRTGNLGELVAIMRAGAARGMATLDASLEAALADKSIDPAAALRRARDREAVAAATVGP